MKKILCIATSRKTKGGITTVLTAYQPCLFWKKYSIRWLETHNDRNRFVKLWYLCKSLTTYLFIVWFYDLVHVHTGEYKSFKRKYIFFQIARWLHKKTIVHIHIGNQIDSYANSRTCQDMLQNADAVVVLTNELKNKISELFSIKESKISVIYNPCKAIENVQFSMGNKTILYAGRLETNKGYHILLEAFAMIAASYPDWKIIFAGNGEIDKAVQLAEAKGILKQVEFRGWITGVEKDRVFREASLLCLPSYNEGFSMTVLEAWAYRLPVVCTKVGFLQDIGIDEENALFFEPGNAGELANRLDRMIADSLLRKRIAEKSHTLATTTFNIQNIAAQIDSLYGYLLSV